ncbi:uncharacterized protein LOC119460620 isoform X2 [Dermacentor silvarum]|uniref:uncharacterized protein LOC119460620 isoform X2 n=1 Tax=Dermacentor silvarum TaxID=543639 RepID=UPI0021019B50|nr:uncharacterized protein LOC119460620 isoform X2 [Dermacentor silvarum]
MISTAAGITGEEDEEERAPLLREQFPRSRRATCGSENERERDNDESEDALLHFVRLEQSTIGRQLMATFVRIKKQSWCVPYLIGMFWFFALLAVSTAFFAKAASEKGLQPWEDGLVFSVRKVGGLLAPAASLAVISYLSPKWGVVISQTAFGIQGILFGLSILLTDKDVYLGVSIVGFVIVEYSLVCSGICIETILASTLQENGNLFLISDISVPYYVFGFALLVFTPLVIRSKHETRDSDPQSLTSDTDDNLEPNEQSEQRKSPWSLLLNPFFMVDVFSRALCWVTTSFNYATLEPHIAELQQSNTCIGAVFMINNLASFFAYAATCSSYSRKYENLWIFIGFLHVAASYLIIGPAPFIQVQPSFALICTSQALRGVGIGFIIVCAWSHAMRIAVEEANHPDDVKTRSFVCSTVAFFSNVITIPLAPLSGFLVSTFGYRAASMWIFGLISVWASVTGFVWLRCGCRQERKSIPPSPSDERPYNELQGCLCLPNHRFI